MRRFLGVAVAIVIASCRSMGGAPAGDTSAVARDTVRGVLSVVGAEPLTTLVLAPSSGGSALAIEGSQEALMRGLSRIEVMATGRVTSRRSPVPGTPLVFEADSFVVRAADRVAAHDGVVAKDGGGFALVSGASRVRLAFLPTALQGRVGARVFLVGPLDRAPIAYGVIDSAP